MKCGSPELPPSFRVRAGVHCRYRLHPADNIRHTLERVRGDRIDMRVTVLTRVEPRRRGCWSHAVVVLLRHERQDVLPRLVPTDALREVGYDNRLPFQSAIFLGTRPVHPTNGHGGLL